MSVELRNSDSHGGAVQPPPVQRRAAPQPPPPPSPQPPPPPAAQAAAIADGEPSLASPPPLEPPPLPASVAQLQTERRQPEQLQSEQSPPDELQFDERESEDFPADEADEADEGGRATWGSTLRGSMAMSVSLCVHLVMFVLLAMWLLPGMARSSPGLIEAQWVKESTEVEMTTVLETADASDSAPSTVAAAFEALSDSGLSGGLAVGEGELALDATASARNFKAEEITIEAPLAGAPGKRELLAAAPDGMRGDPRAIVDGYDEAMDQLTQEMSWMLSRSDAHVAWCFDQSESMKDDQEEIRNRIATVYSQLGLAGRTDNDNLLTTIASFGQGFRIHTTRPTGSVEMIRSAMADIPTDPSGKEMLCQATLLTLEHLRESAKRGRQTAIVLVTDESGDTATNNSLLLEQAIQAAKSIRCRIFVLGREAVFGYPYAHMKWRQPFTGRVHWLPIDRGPETAFVEQLQTDGFRRRYDAHASGFGPYEQCRMARETGGIFFILPSLETNLVRGELRRYELERMRPYLPDLSGRMEQVARRDQSELRRGLFALINDLNPYREEVAKVMEVRYEFTANPQKFLEQARAEQLKARQYLIYLDRAAAGLEALRYHREQEPNPRWQANYDLIYAQVIAYTARTYEYMACLELFIQAPKQVPLEKPKFLRLTWWDVRHTSRTVGGEASESYIARSQEMFQRVIELHGGTPWSARAEWELSRGFGFELHERYHYYGPRSSPSRPAVPIPKL